MKAEPMDEVTRIASALGLPDTGQDWGFEHSDAARLREFVEFAAALKPENDWELEALADLIVQSAEEAIESGLLTQAAACSRRPFSRVACRGVSDHSRAGRAVMSRRAGSSPACCEKRDS
jgi:hypothetical protein